VYILMLLYELLRYVASMKNNNVCKFPSLYIYVCMHACFDMHTSDRESKIASSEKREG
jgi:hypothetical protein